MRELRRSKNSCAMSLRGAQRRSNLEVRLGRLLRFARNDKGNLHDALRSQVQGVQCLSGLVV